MRRLIPYLVFAFLTSFTATSSLPVIAGGCSSHLNKTAEYKCAKDDIECQVERAEKSDFKNPIKS